MKIPSESGFIVVEITITYFKFSDFSNTEAVIIEGIPPSKLEKLRTKMQITKQMQKKLIGFGVPIALFLLYFQFYSFGKVNPAEMVKTTGLVSIALLAITLAIGPLSRFLPFLDSLKAHRKFWGITSFLFAFIHMGLIYIYFFKFDLSKFVNFSNPKYPGLLAGIISLLILLVVTLTSNKKALTSLSPKIWKIIQTTSYLALILALGHFYLMESKDGVLVIKRLLGQLTFGFTGVVIFLRLSVIFLPNKK